MIVEDKDALRRPGERIKRVNVLMYRYFQSVPSNRQFEAMTGTYGRILKAINDYKLGPVYQRDIERWFSIRRSTASITLAKMEKADLIIRRHIDGDKRLKELVLTEKSKAACKMIDDEIVYFETELVDGIKPKDVEKLNECLQIIERNMIRLTKTTVGPNGERLDRPEKQPKAKRDENAPKRKRGRPRKTYASKEDAE